MTVSEAAAQGDIERLRALLAAGGDPNEPETEAHWPPLLEAACHDHVEAARLLLEAGADMYARTEGGDTPLGMAIQQESQGVFRLLLEHGCTLKVEPERAAWILTQAAGNGRIEMVRWLLAQGVEVDITDDSGCTALTRAAHGDRLEVVEELLRAGADPDHRDEDTETVLMYAADHAGNAEVLRALLRAGADVNARSDTGETALGWAVWNSDQGDLEMVQVLLEAGADPNSPRVLTSAAYHGFTAIIALLLKHGADVTVTDSQGETALTIARKQKHREAVMLLKQAEIDQGQQRNGQEFPPPRFPIGTPVRTTNGTPRVGRIANVQWHYQRGQYLYFLAVEGPKVGPKPVSRRNWDTDLEEVADARQEPTE